MNTSTPLSGTATHLHFVKLLWRFPMSLGMILEVLRMARESSKRLFNIVDQWGKWCGIRGKISEKRVLGFHRGTSSSSSSSKSTKSDWVIHEYHYTLLLEHQVDQPIQGTSGSYNTYSEYDSAIKGDWSLL